MTYSLLMLMSVLAQTPAEPPRSDVGDYFNFLDAYAQRKPCALSYLSQSWPDAEAWRKQGRDKMSELTMYHPVPAPKDAEVLETVKKSGYTRYLVRYSITSDRKTEAFLLIPDGLTKPAPAVVALHCHSGFYYYGKEKITETDNPPDCLKNLIDTTYGGRCFADELARHGFVVLVPDAFYFGAQRFPVDSIPPDRVPLELKKEKPGSDAYIRAFNSFSGRSEDLVAKSIFDAGSTWPGILFQGDRASVDYLLTRPEVDGSRIGCLGLSIGGYRAAHLFELDPRVKVGVVAGWMVPYHSILFDHIKNHTWMLYVPGQIPWLELARCGVAERTQSTDGHQLFARQAFYDGGHACRRKPTWRDLRPHGRKGKVHLQVLRRTAFLEDTRAERCHCLAGTLAKIAASAG